MTGRVTEELEIRFQFPLRTSEGWRMVEAVLDTGYSELLSVPAEIAEGMAVIQTTEVELADGSLELVDVVRAKIEWMGEEITVRTLVMGSVPLIGVQLLKGNRLTADFIPGGPVAIIPLDASQ